MAVSRARVLGKLTSALQLSSLANGGLEFPLEAHAPSPRPPNGALGGACSRGPPPVVGYASHGSAASCGSVGGSDKSEKDEKRPHERANSRLSHGRWGTGGAFGSASGVRWSQGEERITEGALGVSERSSTLSPRKKGERRGGILGDEAVLHTDLAELDGILDAMRKTAHKDKAQKVRRGA